LGSSIDAAAQTEERGRRMAVMQRVQEPTSTKEAVSKLSRMAKMAWRC